MIHRSVSCLSLVKPLGSVSGIGESNWLQEVHYKETQAITTTCTQTHTHKSTWLSSPPPLLTPFFPLGMIDTLSLNADSHSLGSLVCGLRCVYTCAWVCTVTTIGGVMVKGGHPALRLTFLTDLSLLVMFCMGSSFTKRVSVCVHRTKTCQNCENQSKDRRARGSDSGVILINCNLSGYVKLLIIF